MQILLIMLIVVLLAFSVLLLALAKQSPREKQTEDKEQEEYIRDYAETVRQTGGSMKKLEHWKVIAIYLIIYDMIAVNFSYFMALLVRFDFRYSSIPTDYFAAWRSFAPIYTIIILVVFGCMHLYNSVWRFASFHELIKITVATVITGVLHIVGITIFWERMPASYYLIGIMLQFFLTVGVRFSYRFVLLERNRREKSEREERSKNVMIIGAGEAGRTIVRELQNAKETNSRVRCLIDDNPNKWGRYMEGVPVVGGRDDIFLNVDKYHINQILLVIPTATPHQKRDILNICKETGCELKQLPGVYQLVNGEVSLSKMKKVAVLGSTGSIGTQTLDVVRANDDLEVVGLAAGSNVEMLEKQIREFHPRLVAVWKEEAARDLAVRVQDLDVKIVSQMGGLIELARMEESDILVTAIVGMIGIRPTMEAILAGKDIALANKETLVTAGHLIMPLAKQFGVQILPVDSEHSAIFQALHGEKREQIHKLLITASGGPFRGKKTADLEKVTLEDTLKHPNWVMGQKITVDSATLVNKGLEVMEARWLFDVDLDHIQVVVQPQSIIHSMVEFEDGAVMAQLGTPDMRLPIQYALCYPDRRFLKGDRLDFHMLKQITFEEPDRKTFKGLPMAVEAARAGGSMPTVFNAANELAVRKFLQKKISFLDIYEIIGQSMSRHTAVKDPDLDQILEIEKETYRWIESRW